jgi:hypothetical protein
MVTHMKLAAEVVADLVRALYTHRGVISEGRLADYGCLLTQVDVSPAEVLRELTSLPDHRITGVIPCRPGAAPEPAGRVLTNCVGMVAVYVAKTFSFLNDQLGHAPDFDAVLSRYPTYQDRLGKAVVLLDALLALDKRRKVVLPAHRKQISSAYSVLYRRVGGFRDFGVESDPAPATIQAWAN